MDKGFTWKMDTLGLAAPPPSSRVGTLAQRRKPLSRAQKSKYLCAGGQCGHGRQREVSVKAQRVKRAGHFQERATKQAQTREGIRASSDRLREGRKC